jgi:DNA-binding SARP family transcriptional activator
VPAAEGDYGRPTSGPPGDLAWLRRELERLRAQVEGIEAALANQRSAFIDIAGARTTELRDALAEIGGATTSLQEEAVRLRKLQDAVAERLHDIVAEVVRPELRAALGQQFPHLVVEALAPDLHHTLADWLPTFVVEAVRPEVRQSLDERLPGVVAEVVTPEVRRTLAERLPHLVAETVRPEVRQTLTERLPGMVAQVVSPEVGAMLVERLPGMLAEAVSPELSVSLAEIEGCAAELRNEAAKMRALRDIVAERLPQAVMSAVEPQLQEALSTRLPLILAQAVQPTVHEALAIELPRLLAGALHPDVARNLADLLPGMVMDSVQPELRQAMSRAVADRLPDLVVDTVEPQVRQTLEGTLPQFVADAVTAAVGSILSQSLPGVVADTVSPDLSVSLAEIEGVAAEMRHETARMRNLRETIAERMPHALVSSVQPVFEDLLAVRLPAMLGQSVGPAIHEALGGQLAGLVEQAVRQEVSGLLEAAGVGGAGGAGSAVEADGGGGPGAAEVEAALDRVEAAMGRLRDEAARLRADREELARELSDAVARTVQEQLAALPLAVAPPAGPGTGAAGREDDDRPHPQAFPERAGPGSGGFARFLAESGPPAPLRTRPEPPASPPPPAPAPAGSGAAAGGAAAGGAAAGGAAAGGAAGGGVASGAPDRPDPPGTAEAGTLTAVLPGIAVGPTLAIGVSEALARARVRRRRRRRAGPPAPGLHRYDPFAGETVRRLERFALARRPIAAGAEGGLEPGAVAVGERDGREVVLHLANHGGVAICGPRARDAVRALVVTFLAASDPSEARALVVGELVPATPGFPGLTRTRDLGSVLTGLEAEVEHRRRLLAEAGADDLGGYRARRPDDPLPILLLVGGDLQPGDGERLQAVLAAGVRVGVGAVLVDSAVDGLPEIRLHESGTVESVSPGPAGNGLVGARIFTLEREPAGELLGVLAGARTDLESEAAPEPPDVPFLLTPPEAPIIEVTLLGGYRIEVSGREIRSGLRAKARELLAFYLLHPEGTGLEEATEALWPEADPRRGSEWFWTALGNLRSRLRMATDDADLKVIEREGDRYRIEPLFDVDLWRFQQALADAAASGGDPNWAATLERTAGLYTGELLAGADWAWAEVPRDDLRRRAVDVLVSLAATRLVAGDVKGALQALQRAVEADPLAEQLYRRIMRLQAKASRPDEVEATFRALQARLGEIGLEPSPESEKLRQELLGA